MLVELAVLSRHDGDDARRILPDLLADHAPHRTEVRSARDAARICSSCLNGSSQSWLTSCSLRSVPALGPLAASRFLHVMKVLLVAFALRDPGALRAVVIQPQEGAERQRGWHRTCIPLASVATGS